MRGVFAIISAFVLSAAILLYAGEAAAYAVYANPGGPYAADEGKTIKFDASASYADEECYISQYAWNFGVGSGYQFRTVPTIDYAYAAPGVYTVTLRVDGYCGGSPVTDEKMTTATVSNVAPTAVIKAYGTTNYGPFTDLIEEYKSKFITLDPSASKDASGTLKLYEWDFNYNGTNFTPSVTTTSSTSQQKSFSAAGTYVVALRVTDQENTTGFVTIIARILNEGPIARITGPSSLDEGRQGKYSASTSDAGPHGPITLYEWDMNYNGTTFNPSVTGAAASSTEIIYPAVGKYKVALRVSDAATPKVSDTVVLEVAVSNLLPVAFIDGPKDFYEGQEVEFNASASYSNPGSIVKYEWSFTYDGADFVPAETTSLPTIKHSFLADGVYKVAVRVTDDDATTAIAAVEVTVKDLGPAAALSCPEKTNERDGAKFDAGGSVSSPDQIAMWEWDFNFNPAVGFSSTPNYGEKTAFYKFADAGAYKVAVRVTDSDGTKAIASCDITVENSAPTAKLDAPAAVKQGDLVKFDGFASIDASLPDAIVKWEWDAQYDGANFAPNAAYGIDKTEITVKYTKAKLERVALRVTDDDDSTSAAFVEFTVENVAPVFVGEPLTAAVQDEVYLYEPAAFDPGGSDDKITFSLDISPAGMEINANNGRLAWTPDNDSVRLVNKVRIKACDSYGGCGTQTFVISVQNVNDPPEILGLSNSVATTCAAFTSTARAKDPDWNDVIYFYLDKAPDGMTIGLRDGAINWQPTFDNIGDNQIILRVEDSASASVTQDFLIKVVPCQEIPAVDAGADFQVNPGLVKLAGTASDPHHPPLPLTYKWTQTGGPASANITEANTLTPSVILRKAGVYSFTFSASNGNYESVPDSVDVTVLNVKPAPQIVCVPNLAPNSDFSLDGTASGDPNGDDLIYSWSASDGTTLSENDLSIVSAKSGVEGTHYAELFVNDGVFSSDKIKRYFSVVSAAKFAPFVVFKNGLVRIKAGQKAALDASATIFPPDAANKKFTWSLVSGPVEESELLDFDPAAQAQSLLLTAKGVYLFEVTAQADGLESEPKYAYAVVGDANNTPPAADAGKWQTAASEKSVALDGSGSRDDNGSALAYIWAQTGGTKVWLTDETKARASFFAVNPGLYEFELRVTNDKGLISAPAKTVVAVLPSSNKLTADAGADSAANPDEEITLDGSASKIPDGPYAAFWCQTAGVPVVLQNARSLKPKFTPPKPGEYGFRLMIESAGQWGLPDDVRVVVLIEKNDPPTAVAPDNVSVNFGKKVVLDGSGSSDPDDDPIIYSWSLVAEQSAGTVAITDADKAQASFVANAAGLLVFRLDVSDGKMSGRPAFTSVTVGANQTPIASAKAVAQAYVNDKITLDGSESYDPDGTDIELTYLWEFKGAGTNPLDDAAIAKPSFTPSKQGIYTFALTVSDGYASAAGADVKITVINKTKDCIDRDGDGYGVGSECKGADCDDDDKTKNAGITGSCDVEPPKKSSGGGCGQGAAAFAIIAALLAAAASRRKEF